jgi:hypothetical protein
VSVGAQEYTVTLRFRVVTKQDRRKIAETAWDVIQRTVDIYSPEWRSGELMEIVRVEK